MSYLEHTSLYASYIYPYYYVLTPYFYFNTCHPMKTTKNLTILSLLAFVVFSCTEPQFTDVNNHEIAVEDGYEDFNQLMLTAKGIVQEVLIAAYQNPELSDFDDSEVTNRTDCPTETDLNPNSFPKTLRYDYGDETCQSDGQSDMTGVVEITVSDKLGTPGMTIIVNPLDNFSKDGHSANLKDLPNAIFMATFKDDTNLADVYDLHISGLEVINDHGKAATLKHLEGATIGFDDVNKDNDEPGSGVAAYLDDRAIINFDHMQFLNHKNELLNVIVRNHISFDFLCKCPLAGSVEIEDQHKKIQYINYASNLGCSGKILVDTEEVGCH